MGKPLRVQGRALAWTGRACERCLCRLVREARDVGHRHGRAAPAARSDERLRQEADRLAGLAREDGGRDRSTVAGSGIEVQAVRAHVRPAREGWGVSVHDVAVERGRVREERFADPTQIFVALLRKRHPRADAGMGKETASRVQRCRLR